MRLLFQFFQLPKSVINYDSFKIACEFRVYDSRVKFPLFVDFQFEKHPAKRNIFLDFRDF